jgi:hypothetical protein
VVALSFASHPRPRGQRAVARSDPEAYLRYVLERIADHPINKLDELLSWKALAQPSKFRLAA